ncbi:Glutaredoxin-c9 [Thalictrum thalictroides]|uniref:Glutaredoxin-c9 n=1 Tax=Thalictrum thalictroides TaxID=46969 RepID=A0A7J6WC75_THATH|nr:Glutaredoxin-c9 [Thalictrum thalictroides]
MQQAIPYTTWKTRRKENGIDKKPSITKNDEESTEENVSKRVKGMVQEDVVVVFGKRGCCMCQVMKYLLLLLGVNPVVCDVEEGDVLGVVDELVTIGKGNGKVVSRPEFPCVYIGGKLFGDMDKLMAAHISGELRPTLKEAGALWL